MSRKLLLAVPFVILLSSPAMAQESCGSAPFAPAMPSAGDMKTKSVADAETALHDAFLDIRNWQGDLKTYRGCLTGEGDSAKAQMTGLDPVKDQQKIAQLKDEKAAADKAFDSTVDQEEKVVNEYHAAQTAYCGRPDANRSKCPK
ncbi:MAG TPA: hypothetical protein VMH86_06540 [Rhizomicrobium sp.]|nr:hypothetical protein [Rhizomicrobium sp.]